ncbi:hypothetical protein NBZ79_08515 [Sneathiella marina]|uniref:Uncharacterized protein n=1 Tax=Sneathiella marina TaxID=2950108 RepID=A0ABY4W755_9PROT|nr:hypothetical protein [Sneathiella marina]USG63020.1 hypothetical protein NBZ79_08515 [Sneathiella marina]
MPNKIEKPIKFKAVADIYHAFFTGLLLSVTLRKDRYAAGDLCFHVFRRQHHEKFLSSFEKLGLTDLPDAVACAQYHYLSNGVGGVPVEYMYESDQKAWVHFCHPRWMYEGAALCGMPLEISHGFLKGWYGQNGVSLKNPRLGFVCTSQDMDGQYGMAGYFKEHSHDLAPEERLQFSPGEMAPPFDADNAPVLDATNWPEERLQKANRNYAMEYAKNALLELAALFGPADATYLGGITSQLIGKQYYRQTADLLGVSGESPEAFAEFMASLIEGQDDQATITSEKDGIHVIQTGWRLMRGTAPHPTSIFDSWNQLWQGALSVHNRYLVLETLQRLDYGDDCFEWRIRRRK